MTKQQQTTINLIRYIIKNSNCKYDNKKLGTNLGFRKNKPYTIITLSDNKPSTLTKITTDLSKYNSYFIVFDLGFNHGIDGTSTRELRVASGEYGKPKKITIDFRTEDTSKIVRYGNKEQQKYFFTSIEKLPNEIKENENYSNISNSLRIKESGKLTDIQDYRKQAIGIYIVFQDNQDNQKEQAKHTQREQARNKSEKEYLFTRWTQDKHYKNQYFELGGNKEHYWTNFQSYYSRGLEYLVDKSGYNLTKIRNGLNKRTEELKRQKAKEKANQFNTTLFVEQTQQAITNLNLKIRKLTDTLNNINTIQYLEQSSGNTYRNTNFCDCMEKLEQLIRRKCNLLEHLNNLINKKYRTIEDIKSNQECLKDLI